MNELEERYAEYIEILKKTLSKKRFTHSMNVAEISAQLAKKHNADIDKAYLAGLLHDIKKEEPHSSMKVMAIQSGMDISYEETQTPALWHGPAGACFIKNQLGITDTDVLNAVRYHTAGRDKMSVTEKIVYLGDLTSQDRSYKDVEKYRKAAFDDLDNAMYLALKYSVEETLGKCGLLPPCTIRGYNYYTRLFLKRNNEDERKKIKI